MDMRPLPREWLPLATQQLRLRNLVRIQGFNIVCDGSNKKTAQIYYTLHASKEEAPFYISEMLSQRHLQKKWAEITCADMLKSNANCVCVKIWARLAQSDVSKAKVLEKETEIEEPLTEQRDKEPTSTLSKLLSSACLENKSQLSNPKDKLLFEWGVYFSGLILISQEMDGKCSANSLIFQINGDYFASPEHFTPESLRKQLSINYQRYSESVPQCGIFAPHDEDEFGINSPQVSRSSSPMPLDWQRDLLRMLKARYLQLNCTRADAQHSYDLQQLLQLQKLQRSRLQKNRESIEIAAEIKHLSVPCITTAQLQRKPRTTSLSSSSSSNVNSSSFHHYHQQQHSMGRALSVLLAEQQTIDPRALLRAQHLQQQLETLHCRQRLLQTQHNLYCMRISKLRQKRVKLSEERQELQTFLKERNEQLEVDNLQLAASYQRQLVQLQSKRHIVQHVESRMSALCMELREIYPIGQDRHGFHTICGIACPNLDAYVNDAKYANSIGLEHVPPLALSAALGYVAHLVQMIAFIINRPLRNPILHEGSRTRIMDIIKEIPYASREFPLYSRSTIPSKPVKYAIFLLNQNIAQLCYDITGKRCDLRATIENINDIFATLSETEHNQCEIHAATRTHPNNRLQLYSSNCGNGGDSNSSTHALDGLSNSHSSVDMNHVLVPPLTTVMTTTTKLLSLQMQPHHSHAIQIAVERNASQQRISRSVGSYSDCEENFNNFKEHCYSTSDSNIQRFQSENV